MTSTWFAVAQKIVHSSGTCLRRVQDVDREAVAEEHHERVPCTDRLRVPHRELDEGVVVAGTPDEARPRRLTERHPEAQDRAGADKGLVEVLHGLDEVGLPNEDVQVVGLLNKDGLQLHVQILPARTAPLPRRRPETKRKGVVVPGRRSPRLQGDGMDTALTSSPVVPTTDAIANLPLAA